MSAVALEHLSAFLRQERQHVSDEQTRVYTSTRLAEIAGEVPAMALAAAIVTLLNRGWIEQFVRVMSPAGSGLKDFPSFEEVPAAVYDWKDTLSEIPVTPEHIQVCYRLRTTANA